MNGDENTNGIFIVLVKFVHKIEIIKWINFQGKSQDRALNVLLYVWGGVRNIITGSLFIIDC